MRWFFKLCIESFLGTDFGPCNSFVITKSLETIKIFEGRSCSKVNFAIGKSEGVWFGKYYVCPESLVQTLNWITKDIEILGIPFGSQHAITDAWSKRTDRLEQKLNAWSNRSLS